MDYSKAKNIMIVLLLAANIALGASYVSRQNDARQARADAAANTERYLTQLGVELETEIPVDTAMMPVLYVRIEKGGGQGVYDGHGVELSGGGEDYYAVPDKRGDTRAETITASRALQLLVGRLDSEQLSGLKIEDIELVFWVDRSGLGAGEAEDTAVPAWKITTNKGIYYIEAYEN